MTRSSQRTSLAACVMASLLMLVACGGGEAEAPPGAQAPPPAAQTITFTSPGNQVFGVQPAPLVASSTSNLTVSFASTTTSVCTVSGTALTLVATGTCVVSASQAGNTSFSPAVPVSNSITVAPGTQTISFISPGNQTLGTAPAALMATATSGLPVSFASSTPAVCTVDGTALTLVATGSCSVSASQSGNQNFAAAQVVSQTFTVAAALIPQTITFASPGSQVLGTAPAPLLATSTSGLTVAFASTTPAICTVSGTTLTLAAAGTCTVVASQAGDATRAAAANVSNSFDVARTPQTITFATPANQTFGAGPVALTATASSGLTVSFASTTLGVCTVSGTAATLVGAGTCSVTASQAGDATRAPATPVSRSFTVAPGSQTITFTSPGGQTLGTPPPALVATASSGLPVSFASTTSGVCTVSGNTLTLVAVGTCTVAANQAGNANYLAAPTVSNSFAVATAPLTPQTINFTSPGSQTLGNPAPALTATASSGLTVSFASTTPGVCDVSGTTLTLVAVGTCTINASQPGNATFAAAPVVSNSFDVVAAALTAQTITFSAPANQTAGTTLQLVATSTSGLPVSFASTTGSVCTVSGTTLSSVAAGTCTVEASQAGNSTFAAAPVVSRQFTVALATVNAFANAGFEVDADFLTPDGLNPSPTEFADSWLGSSTFQATRSSADARSGSWSARLRVPDPGLGGSGLFQNSIDHGGLAPVAPSNWGTSPTLTFWIKGNPSVTGNLTYALRYLNSNGNILNPETPASRTIPANAFSSSSWTLFTRAGTTVPVGTTAVFLEMTLAAGPTGPQPPITCGGNPICDNGQAEVFLDDVNLQLLP